MRKVNNTLIVFVPKLMSFQIFASWMQAYTLKEVRSKKTYLVEITFDIQDDGIENQIKSYLSRLVENEFYMFYKK